MFDNVCRYLAEHFSADLSTWLLGEPVELTELKPTELSLDPIRVDSLILQQSEELILHTEFQTDPKLDLPFRMADYRLRGHRSYPKKTMRQVVIFLRRSNSPLVYQTTFSAGMLTHRYEVVRIWEQPTEAFLHLPGLLPFAVLSQTENREAVLREVAERVEGISDPGIQSNVAASAAILAGLVLGKALIQSVLKEDIMRESVIYQEIKAEGKAEGKVEGKAEGKVEGKSEVALTMLRLGISPEQIAQFTGLSLQQIQQISRQ